MSNIKPKLPPKTTAEGFGTLPLEVEHQASQFILYHSKRGHAGRIVCTAGNDRAEIMKWLRRNRRYYTNGKFHLMRYDKVVVMQRIEEVV